MKHVLSPRRLLALLLAFPLLLASASAAAAFSFRGGITWDTTAEGMIAAENLGAGDYNLVEYNGFQNFYVKAEDVYYVFLGDLPVMMYSQLPGDAYSAEAERQAALYGVPADVSAETVSLLLNLLIPGSTAPGDFSALTAWRFDDGTLAALFIIDSQTYMAYFHEPRILGGT